MKGDINDAIISERIKDSEKKDSEFLLIEKMNVDV